MKRRDWKIKKLERNISDRPYKKKKSRYTLKNIFFLRKLKMRKYRVLVKKNLIINFVFYKKLKNFYFNKLNFFINNIMFKSLNSFINILPTFLYSKKVHLHNVNFFSFLEVNNLNYIFLKNYKKLNNFSDSKYVVFSKSDFEFKNSNVNFLDKDKENTVAINKKFDCKIYEQTNNINVFSYFFNYNIFLLNSIEFYKINILLYINKLI